MEKQKKIIRSREDHTFVICAYKESEYLEECIISLKEQTVHSKILLVTSTPNDWIRKVAEKYAIPVFVNPGEGGITQDWNFGLSKVDTTYATIAHQDDVYETAYLEKILINMDREKKPIIAFTDYYELRNGKKVHDTQMLRIKRIMLAPLRIRHFWKSRFIRRRILSLGDPICCPAVTFCLENIERPIFRNGFRSCEDWEAWEKLSWLKGSYIYIPQPLMCHRIHEESATTAIIGDNARADENYVMYCKFWPAGIAKVINGLYNKSEKSNSLED